MARYSKTLWDTNTVYNPTNMNHIEQGIYDADLREGGTIDGDLIIDDNDGTSSTIGKSELILGNNKASGTAGNSRGILRMYSPTSNRVNCYPPSLTADRDILFPDKSGTIALTDDIKRYRLTHTSFTWNAGNVLFSSDQKLSTIIGNELFLGITGDFTNGSAILGWRQDTNGYIQVMGWIPRIGSAIDNSYQFEIFILTKVQ